jgi:hypothetical protein
VSLEARVLPLLEDHVVGVDGQPEVLEACTDIDLGPILRRVCEEDQSIPQRRVAHVERWRESKRMFERWLNPRPTRRSIRSLPPSSPLRASDGQCDTCPYRSSTLRHRFKLMFNRHSLDA